MSEETGKQIIFGIAIDDSAVKKQMVQLEKEIQATRKAQAELNAEIKKSGTANDTQIQQQLELKAKLKDLNDQQRDNTKQLEVNNQIRKSQTGSIVQLRAQLSSLTKQWNQLSEEERNNANVGGELQKQTKALSDKLKGLESSVGDNRRNVGAYSQSIIEAADSTGLLTRSINTTSEIVDKSKEAFNSAREGFTNFKDGMNGVQKASFLGRKALILLAATPVLILFTGLLTLLTKTQAGMNFLERSIGAVTAAFDVFVNSFAKVGEGLVKLLQDPKRIFTDFNGVVKDLSINLGEVGKAAFKAGEEMYNLIQLEQELKRERILNLSASKLMLRDIEALKNIRDDESKSLKERTEANRKAYELEMKRNAILSNDAKKAMDALIERAAITAGLSKEERERLKLHATNNTLTKEQAKLLKVTDDELQNIIEAQNELFDIQEDSNGKQNEFITNRVALIKEASELQKQKAEEVAEAAKALTEKEYAELQKRLADEKAFIELRLLKSKEFTEQRLQLEVDLNNKEREIALSAKDLTETQKQLLQAQYDQKELEARKKHTQALTDIAKTEADERTAVAQKALEDAKAAINARTEAERQAVEDRKAIRQAEYDAASAIAGAMGELANLVAGQSAEAAEFQKAITLFQIGIDTAMAISNIAQGAAKAGVDTGKVSGPLAPIIAPLTTAAYYASNVGILLSNIAKAKQLVSGDAPKAPKHQYGTIAEGPSHAQGGIGMYVNGYKIGEMEGMEPILTSGVTRNPALLAAASAINVAGGGKPLVHSRHMALGGISPAALAPPRYIPSAGGVGIDYNQLAAAMAKQPVIARWVDWERMSIQQARAAKFRER